MRMLTLLLTPDETAVRSLGTEGQIALPRISIETFDVAVARLERIQNPTGSRLWEPQDLTDYTIQVAIGRPFLVPTDGSYTVTIEGNTTAGIDVEDGLTGLQGALDDAPSNTTVTEIEPGFYKVKWNAPGVKALMEVAPELLVPSAVAEVKMLQEGTVDEVAIQTIRLLQAPAASGVLNTLVDDVTATVTVLQEGSGTANEKVRITFDPIPYDGGFAVIVNGQESDVVSFDATADQLRVALESNSEVGEGNISVIKEGDGRYMLGFQGTKAETNIGTITVNTSGLRAIPMLVGTIETDTEAMEALIGVEDSISLFLEVTGTPDGGADEKLFRQPITVYSAILRPTIA